MTMTIVTAALLLALAVSLQAQAACETSDLAGRWKAYSTGQSVDIGPYIQECTVFANGRGRFRSGSGCTDGSTLRSDDLEISRGCEIRGRFVQRLEGSGSLTCGVRATLSANKEIISGIGACEDGDFFLFNMVRR